jgi:hypothetical protein
VISRRPWACSARSGGRVGGQAHELGAAKLDELLSGYQQETIAAKPGWYVEVCFMETQDKQAHTRLGMERIIKITK